eukprot:1738827-Rhodomonas_salina.3
MYFSKDTLDVAVGKEKTFKEFFGAVRGLNRDQVTPAIVACVIFGSLLSKNFESWPTPNSLLACRHAVLCTPVPVLTWGIFRCRMTRRYEPMRALRDARTGVRISHRLFSDLYVLYAMSGTELGHSA